MTDRELLELAARAAGIGQIVWGDKYKVGDTEVDCTDMPYVSSKSPDESPEYWNPLADDGDALRLAVRLGIDLIFSPEDIEAVAAQHSTLEGNQMISPFAIESWTLTAQDTYAATRRAIVRAAAEIGKTKE